MSAEMNGNNVEAFWERQMLERQLLRTPEYGNVSLCRQWCWTPITGLVGSITLLHVSISDGRCWWDVCIWHIDIFSRDAIGVDSVSL